MEALHLQLFGDHHALDPAGLLGHVGVLVEEGVPFRMARERTSAPYSGSCRRSDGAPDPFHDLRDDVAGEQKHRRPDQR